MAKREHAWRIDPNARPLNDGTPWTDWDTADLTAALESSDGVAEAAMLQRTEREVREKIIELGLSAKLTAP
jgi:hypothetical protein